MMTDLQEYYRELILDHSRRPRHRGELEGATHCGVFAHPQKGDSLSVALRVREERIESAAFTGEGSAMALASASLMTVRVQGMRLEEARALAGEVIAMLESSPDAALDEDALGELAALEGVRRFPARVLCAKLAWEALRAACAARGQGRETVGESK